MNNKWEKDYPVAPNITEESLDENHSLKKLLRFIGEQKQVIDFGCATGYLSQILKNKGCKVTGVEVNPDAAKVAEQHCERVIVADLDLVSIPEVLTSEAFDVVVFGDVLEHLRNPWRVLQETRQLLKPEGYVVASIPNIAHGAIRLALLQGKFVYTKLGILDDTHLRFFTRETVEELFEKSGYFVDSIERTKLPIFSESPLVPNLDKNEFDSELVKKIEEDEEAETLQFILRAFPLFKADKYVALNKRYHQLVAEFERTQSQLHSTQAEFERTQSQLHSTQAEFERTQSQLHSTQAEFERSQSQLHSTQAEFERSQLQLHSTQAEFEQSQSQLHSTQVELERSQSQLHSTQAEFEQSQSQLHSTQVELERSQSQLHSTQVELERSQSQLHSTQAELEHSLRGIAAIKSSKFWKLRERWFGLKRLMSGLPKRFLFFVDSPTCWDIGSDLQVSGWCFSTSRTGLKAVRARIGERTFHGVYGLDRPDVAQTYAGIAGVEKSGFHIQAHLTSGRHELVLEAQDTLEKWHLLATYPIKVTTLRACFDNPNSWEQVSNTILFSGWCFHPEQKITRLTLSCGNICVDCSYGYVRKDVSEVYRDSANSSESGFAVNISVPPGKWQIALNAHLETGEVVSFQSPKTLIVHRYYFWQRSLQQFQKLAIFAELVQKRAVERQQQLGRAPSLQELPMLAGRLVKLYQQQQRQLDLIPAPNFVIPQPIDAYHAWLEVNQWNERSLAHLKSRLKACQGSLPKISVVMPVFNPPIQFLELAIATVVNQVYENWELCIADDRSTDLAVHSTLKRWAASDARIRVVFREENGNISAATNSAASLASSDFLLFLDHDDELTPNALGETALYLAEHPETDFLYSDDDKIDIEGRRFAPQFKPDWSPELLLSYMYLCHLCVVKRSIFEQIGGLRVGFEGSQDYDFALRATEISRHVGHLPLVLYHWRAAPGSTAVSGSAKPNSFAAGQKALQEAFSRRSITGTVYQPEWALKAGVGIFDHQFPDQGPSVAIIIPTKNQLSLLQRCLDSLEKTTYQNYQVVVIDNESDDPETLAYLDCIPQRVLRIPNPGTGFNFAAINNRAAEQVESEYILFLNNDTEVISPFWLSQMVGYAQVKGVGAVGARLLFPDQRVQHAGVIHGLGHGLAGHAFKLAPAWDNGYLSYAKVVRNYSAVTAACLLTPRKLFMELSGFDENQFGVAYNDVDYCYRLVDQGYRCVYCPTAELIHYEGFSRGFVDNPKEPAALKRKYSSKVDSFYSPHLSLQDGNFQLQARRFYRGEVHRLKVLMCSNALDFTGAPFIQYELAVNLASKGIITPIIFCVSDGPLREAYEQHGIQVIVREHPLAGIHRIDEYYEAIRVLGKEIEGYGFDLVYANTLESFFMVDCVHSISIPSIWNVHESEPWQTYFNRFGFEIAARALECFRFPYKVIFGSDATQNRFLPLNSHHNFTVIYNMLDLNRLGEAARQWTRAEARQSLNVDPQEVFILLLGTVCERKGQHDLVSAIACLPQKWHDQIRCFIVGDRPSIYSSQMAGMVAELPSALKQRVVIVPETSDTARYYQAADIFVCTSRTECFPRVILEAMVYGLPIVTTPVFGIKEQVHNGVNAIFYTPEHSEELQAAIVSLLEDEGLRSRLAENSPHVLGCLDSYENMVQSYAQIFREASFTLPGKPAIQAENSTK